MSFSSTPAPPAATSTLSLHDALPILAAPAPEPSGSREIVRVPDTGAAATTGGGARVRSEEHTSELQSRFDLVCRLLLEKKNKRSSAPRSRTASWFCRVRWISQPLASP